ncbi:MAG: hypothetical protein RIG84_08410 [Roseovarius sp.]
MRSHHGENGRGAPGNGDAGRGPATGPTMAPCRGELASLALAGWLAPDILLEQVFDRIEGGRA